MVKQLAQGDTANKWQSQHWSPCSLMPAPLLCTISSLNLDILGLRRVMAGIRKKKFDIYKMLCGRKGVQKAKMQNHKT